MFEEISTLITNVGFPIAISCYLLYRDSKTIATLAEAINANTVAVTKLIARLDNNHVGE